MTMSVNPSAFLNLTTAFLAAGCSFEGRATSSDAGPDPSLVGRWPLDGNVTDASGRGHDGMIQGGATFAPGFLGQALSLDGVNGHALVADASDHDFGVGDFSLEALVHPLRDGMAEALITKRDSGNGYELYRSASGQLIFFGAGCGNGATGGDLPAGVWSRVAATRKAGVIGLFVNGAQTGTGACADNFANAGSLAFGCNGPDLGCGEPFQGRIDEVSLRNTASEDATAVNDFCAHQALAGVAPLPAECNP